MSNGVICAATTPAYARLAYALALSVKLTNPSLGVSVITDSESNFSPEWREIFDVIHVDHSHLSNKFHQRALFYDVSPYDLTVAVDADVIFTGDVSADLERFASADVVVGAPITYRGSPITDRRFREVFDRQGLADAYSAYFSFKKTDAARRLFDTFEDVLTYWDTWRGVLRAPDFFTQPVTTDVALGVALRATGTDVDTAGARPRFVHLKPELQGGHTPEPRLTFAANALRVDVGGIVQTAPLHYFNKSWMSDERLKLMEELYAVHRA